MEQHPSIECEASVTLYRAAESIKRGQPNSDTHVTMHSNSNLHEKTVACRTLTSHHTLRKCFARRQENAAHTRALMFMGRRVTVCHEHHQFHDVTDTGYHQLLSVHGYTIRSPCQRFHWLGFREGLPESNHNCDRLWFRSETGLDDRRTFDLLARCFK